MQNPIIASVSLIGGGAKGVSPWYVSLCAVCTTGFASCIRSLCVWWNDFFVGKFLVLFLQNRFWRNKFIRSFELQCFIIHYIKLRYLIWL